MPRMTNAELVDAALTLEYESGFYHAYALSSKHTAMGDRRQVIDYWCNHLNMRPKGSLVGTDIRDRELLRRYFDDRYQLPPLREVSMSVAFQSFLQEPRRPPDFFFSDDPAPAHNVTPSPVPTTETTQLTEKETTMTSTLNTAAAIEITTKTLVNGTNVADLSDAAIYDLIAKQEAEIERLEAIKAKPKKLVAEIAKRREGIQALVNHLDSKAD